MSGNDEYWSIDFPGIDGEQAQAIVDSAERSGLGVGAIVADPEVFMTVHLDRDTVVALEDALTKVGALGEPADRIVAGVLEALVEWRSGRD